VRSELPALERIYVIEPPEGPLPDGVYEAADLLTTTPPTSMRSPPRPTPTTSRP
jgi:hypothetical protein